MSGKKSPHVAERKAKIVQQFVDGTRVPDLARLHGLSTAAVWKIVKGVTRNKRSPTRRVTRKPISNLHAQIGFDISHRRVGVMNLGPQEFAAKASLSRQRLLDIEAGIYDPSLSDLTRICPILGTSPEILITPRSTFQGGGS